MKETSSYLSSCERRSSGFVPDGRTRCDLIWPRWLTHRNNSADVSNIGRVGLYKTGFKGISSFDIILLLLFPQFSLCPNDYGDAPISGLPEKSTPSRCLRIIPSASLETPPQEIATAFAFFLASIFLPCSSKILSVWIWARSSLSVFSGSEIR